MKVLVDTSIWSSAFRRSNNISSSEVEELKQLISESRVVMVGPIRQELLSGISNLSVFNNLKEKLRAFDDEQINTEHYELAAELFNLCRKNGVQGSHIDFLLCAVSIKNNYSIFTLDHDFLNYKKYIPIKLHSVRKELIKDS